MSFLESEVNSSWDTCHPDIWHMISKYLRPEDTLTFALICRRTNFVVNTESFWSGLFNRFIRSIYPWLDRLTTPEGSSTRDVTIRELFKNYRPLCNRILDPDSYDKVTNKICLKIHHTFDETLNIRTYYIKVKSKFKNYGPLAKLNVHEGCQLLLIKTKHFVPVPYDSENFTIKSISKTLSRGFRAYKLKLEFCDQFGNRAGETIIFDPIISLQLYDWWHPNYEKLLNEMF